MEKTVGYDVRGLPPEGAGCGRGSRDPHDAHRKYLDAAILADPSGRLTRASANSTRPGHAPRAAQDADSTPAGQPIRRSAVNTSMPATIVPSMVRRHRNQPKPARAA
ncbi:hypothetical protein LIG30_2858 [Burkholderia sp. lig30]|nr:hypothetical protein LIG30_2858 [Burkholderia sp. lig30]